MLFNLVLSSLLSFTLCNAFGPHFRLKSNTTTVFADRYSYFLEVCLPQEKLTDRAYHDAPCWGMVAIENECLYDISVEAMTAKAFPIALPLRGAIPSMDRGTFKELSYRDQQVCFCQSQWIEQLRGCQACIEAHNLRGIDALYETTLTYPPSNVISNFTSSYCVASSTPSVGFGDAVYSAFGWKRLLPLIDYNRLKSQSSQRTSVTMTDPLGPAATAASYYFTPSAPVEQVWPVITPLAPQATVTAFDSVVIKNTKNGLIVPPTAVSSTATRSGSAARETGKQAVLAGAIGLAAAVLMV